MLEGGLVVLNQRPRNIIPLVVRSLDPLQSTRSKTNEEDNVSTLNDLKGIFTWLLIGNGIASLCCFWKCLTHPSSGFDIYLFLRRFMLK